MEYTLRGLRKLSDEALAEYVQSALAVINTIAPTFPTALGTRAGLKTQHANLEHAMVALLDVCQEQARRNKNVIDR